jgi:hypothetical protein
VTEPSTLRRRSTVREPAPSIRFDEQSPATPAPIQPVPQTPAHEPPAAEEPQPERPRKSGWWRR